MTYCKTLFFRRILISRFPYVENLLHFNLADFPVNFIKQLFCFLFLLVPHSSVIIKIRPILLFTLYNTKNIAYPITEELIFYADKIMVRAIPKIRVYLMSQFYSNRENLMLAKYTRFTVYCVWWDVKPYSTIIHPPSQHWHYLLPTPSLCMS